MCSIKKTGKQEFAEILSKILTQTIKNILTRNEQQNIKWKKDENSCNSTWIFRVIYNLYLNITPAYMFYIQIFKNYHIFESDSSSD